MDLILLCCGCLHGVSGVPAAPLWLKRGVAWQGPVSVSAHSQLSADPARPCRAVSFHTLSMPVSSVIELLPVPPGEARDGKWRLLSPSSILTLRQTCACGPQLQSPRAPAPLLPWAAKLFQAGERLLPVSPREGRLLASLRGSVSELLPCLAPSHRWLIPLGLRRGALGRGWWLRASSPPSQRQRQRLLLVIWCKTYVRAGASSGSCGDRKLSVCTSASATASSDMLRLLLHASIREADWVSCRRCCAHGGGSFGSPATASFSCATNRRAPRGEGWH